MSSLDSKRPYIFTVHSVLSATECRDFIDRIERETMHPAPINTAFGERVKSELRNNERVMFTDAAMAALLLDRVRAEAPADIGGSTLVGANELLRCYRYKPGMYFSPHVDGSFVRDDLECSWYTLIVYLNADFEGGHTTFLVEPEVSIKPEAGMALLFQHPIVHEGSLVTRGTKYVVRSDLMYRRSA
jgi:predicted 2-oxoglutarate/Fe(II)-dependent dioxygenase YbiX